MELTTTLGIVAGTLTTLAYLPQVIKTWRSKSADGVSWSMLIILCLGISLWLVYGLYIHDLPVICANVVTLLLSSIILGLKIRYEGVATMRAANGALLSQGKRLTTLLPQRRAISLMSLQVSTSLDSELI
jgi:MtN3 and saliva related transmembrane protein